MQNKWKTAGCTLTIASMLTYIIVLAGGNTGCEVVEGETTGMNVAGTWNYADSSGNQSSWLLTQSVDDITGIGTDGGTISGTVYSVYIVLKHCASNTTTYLDGNIAEDTNSITGTFSNTFGNVGTWVALKTD